jgi:hypothetical protein
LHLMLTEAKTAEKVIGRRLSCGQICQCNCP